MEQVFMGIKSKTEQKEWIAEIEEFGKESEYSKILNESANFMLRDILVKNQATDTLRVEDLLEALDREISAKAYVELRLGTTNTDTNGLHSQDRRPNLPGPSSTGKNAGTFSNSSDDVGNVFKTHVPAAAANLRTVLDADARIMYSDNIQKLFELENIGITSLESDKDQGTLKYFREYSKTITFDGNYITVPFPLKDNIAELSDNYGVAIKRLAALQRNLHASGEQMEWYSRTLTDYEHQNGNIKYSLPDTASANCDDDLSYDPDLIQTTKQAVKHWSTLLKLPINFGNGGAPNI
ncbi:unnamed protein product [Cylicocyclus nassatus]|uniref:Uncharacterized protein n=1 Tax=Cylicocyclus nassatus TaxID=53992 RepID=A0AA36H9U9_CYLNA|nr:unnamed protein product [Cylicocyclus nassatus]